MNKRSNPQAGSVNHLFFVQSAIQLWLSMAILRDANIPVDQALIVAHRGMVKMADQVAVKVMDGDVFFGQYSSWVLPSLFKNTKRRARYQREVLDLLSDDCILYAPNFDIWYQFETAKQLKTVNVLEDGFASYNNTKSLIDDFTHIRIPWYKRRWYDFKFSLAHGGRYWRRREENVAYLLNAPKYFITSSYAFPEVDNDRKVVLADVFPADRTGEFTGAIVLATSSMVESGYLSLPVYLSVLKKVLDACKKKPVKKLFVKLHPVQENKGTAATEYRSWIKQQANPVEVAFLGIEDSLERISSGSPITLLTGKSSLAVYVKNNGGKVYSYYKELAREGKDIEHFKLQMPAAFIENFYPPLSDFLPAIDTL